MLLDLLSRPGAYPYDLFNRFWSRIGWSWSIFFNHSLVITAFIRLHFVVTKAMAKIVIHVHNLKCLLASPS